MSEKTKQILENLKSITQKEPEEDKSVGPIASNLDGDRIYSNLNNNIHLVNVDGSTYKGKIYKRRITLKDIDGGNFFAHAYETDDGRWFDRAGLLEEARQAMQTQMDEQRQAVELEAHKKQLTLF